MLDRVPVFATFFCVFFIFFLRGVDKRQQRKPSPLDFSELELARAVAIEAFDKKIYKVKSGIKLIMTAIGVAEEELKY